MRCTIQKKDMAMTINVPDSKAITGKTVTVKIDGRWSYGWKIIKIFPS